MKSPQPSALATWLLEHLTPPAIRDPLIGDLLENYSYHPSSVWYWRQVLGAILVSFATQFCHRWLVILFVLFAIAVCAALPWPGPWLYWSINLPWPASFLTEIATLCAPQGLIIVVSLMLYRLINRNIHVRRLFSGLLFSLIFLSIGNLLLWVSLNLTHSHPHAVVAIWRLPLFVAVVAALWIATPKVQDAAASPSV